MSKRHNAWSAPSPKDAIVEPDEREPVESFMPEGEYPDAEDMSPHPVWTRHSAPAESTFTDRVFASAVNAVHPVFGWPWWAQVTLIFVITRVIAFIILACVAMHQDLSPWGPAHPDYWHFVDIWDSEWYHRIFTSGYPQAVPRDAAGMAQSNTWAFLPLFPFVVKALSFVAPGASWSALGQIVALVFALAAALMIYKLFRLVASHKASLWGVAFVLLFPCSPVLQVPYAESMNLFFLALGLYLVMRAKYLWCVPVVFLLALSRPVGVPFGLMLGLYFLYRWVRHKKEAFPMREVWQLLVLGAASVLAALAWPLIAWARTGEPSAYTDTEASWRFSALVPLQPWFDRGNYLVGPWFGFLFPIVLALLLYFVLTCRPVRALGPVMQWWCAAYFIYILLFLNPQTSTFRLLIPMFPLALAVALLSKSKAYRWSTAVMYILMQIVWVYWLWRWAMLPGGGDYPP